VRILIVSQYFWPETFRINDLAKTLALKGVAVDVMTGKPNYPEGQVYDGFRASGIQTAGWSGLTIHRIPIVPRGSKGAIRLAMNYLSFIISGTVFGPWLFRKTQHDVIFVYGVSPILQAIPALFLGRIKCTPVIVWVQDLWPESLAATGYIRSPKLLAQVGRLVSFIYRRADLLLVQSRAFIPFISSMANGTKIVYYPNSVDDSFGSLSCEAALPHIAALEEGFPVLFAGNIGSGQAVEVIVGAALLLKDHPQIRFVVVGSGSSREWMKQQVEALQLTNLHLPGRFPIETMPGLMRKAGALLVSLADEPIFAATVPNKVQAYMASGMPILASLDGEGARLVTEAQAGLVSPSGNAALLAEATLKMFNMTQVERDRLGDNGRKFFKLHFDHTMLTERLIDILNQTAEARRASL
jgi:glycosyltransferase involved in cell wall biosynthesis